MHSVLISAHSAWWQSAASSHRLRILQALRVLTRDVALLHVCIAIGGVAPICAELAVYTAAHFPGNEPDFDPQALVEIASMCLLFMHSCEQDSREQELMHIFYPCNVFLITFPNTPHSCHPNRHYQALCGFHRPVRIHAAEFRLANTRCRRGYGHAHGIVRRATAAH